MAQLRLRLQEELANLRINMKMPSTIPLVFDLGAMDAALDRMEMLAATLVERTSRLADAVRLLMDTLFCGCSRICASLRSSGRTSTCWRAKRWNVPATVANTISLTAAGNTGRCAAPTVAELTVFTAAIKLHLIGEHWPPFMEASDRQNYAMSSVAAGLRSCPGHKAACANRSQVGGHYPPQPWDSPRDQITQYGASISRTQLAAALGNILAVSAGAVIFNLLWLRGFHMSYVPAEQAQKVYLSAPSFGLGNRH